MDVYPRAAWRLIRSTPLDGATQMAVDEAIWQAVAAGLAPPTLRLYAWEPPCLSLGRHQPVAEADRDALRAAGYTLVRRPTGGRAILHADELTYSVAVPLTDPRARGDVVASCRKLSQGLMQALDLLGVRGATARQGKEGASNQGPVCFETPAHFEITVAQRKLVGSAQARGRGALLQHGTIPIRGDISRICSFLTVPADPHRVRARAMTLEQALGRQPPWEEVAGAMAEGFAQALNLHLERGGLAPLERETADRLRGEKYAAETWTARF